MNMLSARDGRDDLTDVLAVFDYGVSDLQVDEGNLVSDRNVVARREPEIGVVLGDDAQHVCARFQSFDHDNTNVVFVIVHEQLWNAHSCTPGCACEGKSYIRY